METSHKKQFTFRGKTLEELQALDVREFAKLAPARARRTILRNFHNIENFVSRAKKRQEKNRPIRTHTRDLVIVPAMVGMRIFIYNGQQFQSVDVMPEMLGHFFGEFSLTRARIKHGSAGVGATKGSAHKSKK